MIFLQMPVGPMRNFAYVIGDEGSSECVLVDPSFDIDRILDAVEGKGLRVKFIVNTHFHKDHTQGNEEAVRRTGARMAMHASSFLRKDIALNDGDLITLGMVVIKVLHTPGHTPDGICLLVDKKLLTGDTLFVGECGRIDLPGGDARLLYRSLFDKIAKLDRDTEIYPGHDYGPRPSSTVGYELRYNYVLQPRSEDEFVGFMASP